MLLEPKTRKLDFKKIKKVKKKLRKINYLKPKNFTLLCKLEWVYDPQFFAILPALNINFHSRTLELEWLSFAFYIDFTIPESNEERR